jgi:hypothetical protein
MASKVLDTKRITTKTMFRMFVEEYPDIVVSYKDFKKYMGDLNKAIIEACLEGGTYKFGNNIGTWSIAKYERKPYLDENGNLRGTRPDYGATRKAKASGKNIVIYHTNTLICKWHWTKSLAGGYRVKHIGKWSLVPTDGPLGISRKLHHYVEANPRSTMHYKNIKIRRRKK